MKKIIFLFILFSSCVPSKKSIQSELQNDLYTKAFCVLIDAKQNYSTPGLKSDSIRVLNQFYIDTTNLYYNFTNLNYELCFIDTINFPQFKGEKEDWEQYKRFNSLMNKTFHHKIDATCLDSIKVKFLSKNEITDKFQGYNTLLYSPLLKRKNGLYIIYEHRLNVYQDYYYSYAFKLVNNDFEFVDRIYHSDVFLRVKDDYMKNVDFNQTYEGFVKNKN